MVGLHAGSDELHVRGPLRREFLVEDVEGKRVGKQFAELVDFAGMVKMLKVA